MKNQNIIIKWLICFAIFGVQGLCLIASPIVHTLAADYPDVPLTTVRMITTIPSLAAFVGAMFLAPMLGKVLRYKTALIIGTSLAFVGGVLPAFWNARFSYIIIARVIFGCGFAMFSMRNAITARTYGEVQAAVWMGNGSFLVSFLSIVTQLISGMLGDISWKYSFLLHSLAAVLIFIAVFLYEEPEGAEKGSPERVRVKKSGSALVPPSVIFYFLMILTSMLCLFPFLSSISIFVAERGLGSATQSSWVSSAYSAGGAVASLIFAAAYAKYSRWIMSLSCLTVIAGYVLTLAGVNISMVIMGSALCGGGAALITLIYSKWSMDASDESNRALSMTLIPCGVSGGSFLSSYYMIFARKVGAMIPLFETEIEKTFLVGIIIYAVIFILMTVKDFRVLGKR
ncbi:MAG: MFS transporter [Lachnospiraceae bacterium]|jgi:predicted MFS family arabinose efflux permease|nr:MFS transporter [Lachnospiraceae bacterium]NBJ82750.1 MFS transporter [bacterium 1XD42-76]NBK06041.1 MFS transporter [bacterium 1XD42-94]